MLLLLIAGGAAGGVVYLRHEHQNKQTSVAPPPVPAPVAVTSSPAVTSPEDPVAEQAKTLDGLLDRDVSAHANVPAAIEDANNCTNLSNAETVLETAASDRSQLLGELQETDLSALPNSTDLVAALQDVFSYTASSDKSYAAWVSALETGACPQDDNSDVGDGAISDRQATAAKTRFLALWNPLAAQYGATSRTVDDL